MALGVHITSRGIWTECQKSKADQANKVLFSLKTIFKQFYNLQPNILMKIFDGKILPIDYFIMDPKFGVSTKEKMLTLFIQNTVNLY